jgi:LysM repeat protein
MYIRHLAIQLFLVFTLGVGAVFSQEKPRVEKSLVVETIQGHDYYIHTVKKGETLFSISKAYEISLDKLKENNFALTEGIVPGEMIKIPKSGPPQLIEEPVLQGEVNYRRVQQGETLYGIAREYGIPVEMIKAANNGLPDGLKSGMFLKIPLLKDTVLDKSSNDGQGDKTGFFEFQAKEKTTIYQVALRYRVSVDSILFYNKGIEESIRPGKIIKIPLISHQPGYITHTVTKRETVVRLARKYNIDVNLIKSINPYVSRHLANGQVVRIPLLKMDAGDGPPMDRPVEGDDGAIEEASRPKSSKEKCFESYVNDSYKIALLMPLYFSEVDTILMDGAMEENNFVPASFIKPFTFLQFYQGFMMAVDSLEKAGLKAKIHVYNVEDDVMQTRELLENPELKQMDLIVGPFFSHNFKMVADFAKNHGINIVNPLSTREEVTMGNPFVFQPQPLRATQYTALVDFLNEEHDHSQIFIARHNPYQDFVAFEDLQSTFNEKLEPRQIPTTALYHEITYSRDSLFTFIHTASEEHENVIVTYSENKLFILDLLRNLNQLRDTFQITVVGMPNWREIDGLEYEHLNNLNTHFIADQFNDYEKPVVKEFVADFHERYATDPGTFAFNGYNIGIYFLGAMMKFGARFNDCIPHFGMELLNMGYQFETSSNRGFNNVHWKMLEMYQFELKDHTTPLPQYDLSAPPGKYYKYMDLD